MHQGEAVTQPREEGAALAGEADEGAGSGHMDGGSKGGVEGGGTRGRFAADTVRREDAFFELFW